ncbi:hypothetical protein AsAng_0011020 [Aureispira anguillae]|uniref:Uncharacterized protein n=1 Tax=Aureispira anguillae TaxID=2864201 RepID=A0A915YC70_9BACT|nr:hypothetical protein AsAng_0011020 [Aureispira anguillae]
MYTKTIVTTTISKKNKKKSKNKLSAQCINAFILMIVQLVMLTFNKIFLS